MQKKTRIYFNRSIKAVTNAYCGIREIFLKCFFHRRLLSLLLLLATGITGLQAQSLYVRENNGTQISFAINDIRSITFPQGIVAIIKAEGNTSTFSIADIRYLNFSDTTGVNSIADREKASFQIYPNPASNLLHITFNSGKANNVHFSVINLHGKILQQQIINSYEGENIAEMNVSSLIPGIYLFRFQNREKTETRKFLKN